jgi:hypothetical protein
VRFPRFEEDKTPTESFARLQNVTPVLTIQYMLEVLEELKRRQTYVTNENLILKYVHKKFRVSTIKTEMLDENIIREANLRLRYVLSRWYFIEIYKCIYFDHKRTTEKRKNFLEKRRRLEVAVLYREAKHRATIHQLSLIH